jgi:CDP-glucose 4,6-dehydratase
VENLEVTASLPDAAFWRGKRVLVTGHTGFKGAWLWLVLQRLGARTCGLALPPESRPNLFDSAEIGRTGESHSVDINDREAVAHIVSQFRPEIVLHLAAQALVRRSHREPVQTFSTNVLGTVHVLDTVRECESARATVVVTTDKVYRNKEEGIAFREEDAFGGHDPYSASKAAAEIVVESYRQSFFSAAEKGLASARAGNVIGGGDWSEDRIIPDAMRAWLGARPLQVRYPEAIRPWQHVLEPVCAYLRLAEKIHGDPSASGSFNFGPDPSDMASVRQVVEAARLSFGSGDIEWGVRPDNLHEATTLSLDNTKAKTELGVAPVWGLREAVDRTVSWYRRQADGQSARSLCEEDIEAFFESV